MYEYKKRRGKFGRFILNFLLIIFVSIISILIYDMYINLNSFSHNQQSSDVQGTRMLYSEDNSNDHITEILENTIKCVVGISKIKSTGNSIFLNNSTSELGLGTGIIVSENGYILTNWHVSGDKYTNCYIALENGKVVNGSVKWADKDLDLAIIKINLNNLNYLRFGDSDKIKIGEKAYAIGNPIGVEFQRTVTSGIISGINRTVKIDDENGTTYMEDLIQTDATINPGNSGGPLINSQGEVIGINSIKITEAEGIGFAIPINIVKPIIESFYTTGNFEEAYLGVFAYDKNVIPYLDSGLHLNSGIYIAQISLDGPSYTSGLKIGDIITKIDEKTINKMSELRSYIYTKKAGDEIKLTFLRNNKERTVNIKLAKKS